MKFTKQLLLGSTAGLTAVVGAQAADLPVTKAAPIEYVRVCTAYGAGFFYIPGTDTCLRVGGRARFEYGYASQRSMGVYGATTFAPLTLQNTVVGGAVIPFTSGSLAAGTLAAGAVPVATNYAPIGSSNNDLSGTRGSGTLNIDARTATSYGTLRAFVRFIMTYQTGQNHLKTGTVERYGTAFGGTGVDIFGRGQTQVVADKAFVQFAGITAGRAGSFFDFYAHDLEISARTVGSDVSSINLLAYTATLGGGFTATVSMEDPTPRRNPVFGVGGLSPFSGFVNQSATTLSPATTGANVFVANVTNVSPVGVTFDPITGLPTVARFLDVVQRNIMPDFVANLRYDQPWGSVQLSGAVHHIALGQYDPNIDYRFTNFNNVANGGVFTAGAFLTPFGANQAGLGLRSPFFIGAPLTAAPATAAVPGVTPLLTLPLNSAVLAAANAASVAAAQNAVLGAPMGHRPDSELGWAIQGGLKLNLPMIAKGDLLYLQAAYSEGSLSYTGAQGGIGAEIIAASFTNQLTVNAVDAAVDAFGRLHLTKSFSAVGALLHYWTPEIRQAFFGSYSRIDYDSILRSGFGPAGVFPLATANGVTNFGTAYQLSVDPRLRDYHENLIGSNVIWSPVRNLDIGLEAFYQRITIDKGRVIDTNKNQPIGAISNTTGAPVALGTPNSTALYKTTKFDDQFVTRFRVQRDF